MQKGGYAIKIWAWGNHQPVSEGFVGDPCFPLQSLRGILSHVVSQWRVLDVPTK
jgi:hypothetical protein